jgi:hypothetical protein
MIVTSFPLKGSGKPITILADESLANHLRLKKFDLLEGFVQSGQGNDKATR